MKAMTKASGTPSLFIMYRGTSSNPFNFSSSSSSLKLPQSKFSFSVSRPLHLRSSGSTSLLLTNNQNARPLTFRCHCTNVENPAETITGNDSRVSKQYVPKLETIWMLFWEPTKNAFSTISNVTINCLLLLLLCPCALFATVKFILQSKKKEPRNVSFDELVGVGATRKEFDHIISILQGKIEFKKHRMELPEGVLLYGSQGTGKTTLVHALAREAGVSFFPVSAKDIAKGGPRSVKIKNLFIEARAYSPSIVLIEDVDVIARDGTCDPALHLLDLEIESCNEDRSMVMVIVSTNKPETLDSALKRYFRFFKKVHMGLPDEDSRRQIAGVHLNMVVREDDKEAICNLVASRTPGLVWADIKCIADQSKRYAASRGDDHVTMDDVLRALGMLTSHYH